MVMKIGLSPTSEEKIIERINKLLSKYLTVEQEFIPGRKTPIYNVWRTGGIFLGSVHWRGSWRQYVWTQESNVDMSKGCLEELWAKVDAFEKERKEAI